jgi:arginase
VSPIRLIEVPYVAGDDRHPASAGPRRIVEALRASAAVVEREAPFRDTATAAADVNRRLAALVREAITTDELPVALSGSCNAALGVLAGFDHSRCGVVWIDAHADFNTPESTSSGFFPGMSAAVIAGHCYRDYWSALGGAAVAEEEIVMVGVRELSPGAERERLARSAVRVVAPTPEGLARELDDLALRVGDVYLHVDLDVLDAEFAPGVVDEPVPEGLSPEDVERVIAATAARIPIRAVTLATFNPERDRGGKTLRTVLRLVGLVGEIAARQRQQSF